MLEVNREYLTYQILSASSMELIRILYERALDYTKQAAQHERDKRPMERGRAVTRAVRILNELNASLVTVPDDGGYTKRLSRLYLYMIVRLQKAHFEQSLELLQEVAGLLQTLLDGWSRAIEKQRTPAPTEASAFFGGMAETADAGHSNFSWQF